MFYIIVISFDLIYYWVSKVEECKGIKKKNSQEMESKAFSKSINLRSPGIVVHKVVS